MPEISTALPTNWRETRSGLYRMVLVRGEIGWFYIVVYDNRRKEGFRRLLLEHNA